MFGRRQFRHRALLVVCAIACAAALPAVAAATVTHDGSRTFRVTETGHNFNICGQLGTFDMVISTEWHATEANGGIHFQLTETSRWTVTFDDPALGVWNGRGTETAVLAQTRGQTLEYHLIFNGSEGPVRIHEFLQILVAADGTVRVDLEKVTTDYGACPS
jgi:hypothetical protein